MEEFIRGQRENLDQIRQAPHFRVLIGAVDVAYGSAVDAVPRIRVPIIFGRILLVCHKSMLSAATLIAQGQPEDSTGITRRALETAKVALAIKINDSNALQWTSYQERLDRWLKRQQNEKPRSFVVRFTDSGGPFDGTDRHPSWYLVRRERALHARILLEPRLGSESNRGW